METPISGIIPVLGFSPIVSVHLEELVENYGDPDYVWFTYGDSMETDTMGIVLYWNSISMYVELPPIPNKTYVVKKMTEVEMIIFFDEQPVIGIAGRPLKERISWTGYGNYQP